MTVDPILPLPVEDTKPKPKRKTKAKTQVVPGIEIVLNMVYPERSRVLVNGVDLGATQIECRWGKVSHNEAVIRVPRDRVKMQFVGRTSGKRKTYND